MNPFQVGGALRPGAVYAERGADQELLRRLAAGELAYVLAPRQMGKSSLLVRTAAALRARGLRTASVDLSALGSADATPDRWFLAVLDEICAELGAEDPLPGWAARSHLPSPQRFLLGLRACALAGPEPVVIFLDEVDAVLGLPFPADDLFAAVRATVNLRAEDPLWARVCFCLLGVASPAELVSDPARTPFNVGVSVSLEDLSREEARAFEVPLRPMVGDAPGILDAVWAWTHGHPYMTQRLCATIVEERVAPGGTADPVRALVERLFLASGPLGDINLASAGRAVLLREHPERALALYRRVWEGLPVPADAADPAVTRLLLSGMVAREPGPAGPVLRVRNRIFAEVFGRAWLEEHLGRRALLDAAAAWVASGRREEELLRGAALERAQRWAEGRPDLAPDEVALLLASADFARREEEREQREARLLAEAQHETERRLAAETHVRAQRRLIRWLALVSVGMALALLGAGLFYLRAVAAGRGLSAAEDARAEVWRESARLATGVPGREDEALGWALRVLEHEQGRVGAVSSETRVLLLDALAASTRVTRLHLTSGAPTAALWSPDSEELWVAEEGGQIARWDLETRQPTRMAQASGARVYRLLAVPGGFAAADEGGVVQVFDGAGRRLRAWTAHEGLPYHAALSLSLSPDGTRLVSGGQDGAARVWELATGRLILTLRGPEPISWHQASLHDVAFSPDGAIIAGGAEDSRIYLWDAQTGAPLRSVETGHDQAGVLRFLEDHTLLFGTFQGWVGRLDPADGERVSGWQAGKGRITGLQVVGPELVTCATDGELRRWEIASGRLLRTATGATSALNGMMAAPDGQDLALWTAEDELRVWRERSRIAEPRLPHPDTVLDAVWLDERRVLSGGVDGVARIWDRSGDLVRSWTVGAPITAVAGLPDGTLVTADEALRLIAWGSGPEPVTLTLTGPLAQILPERAIGGALLVGKDGLVQRLDLRGARVSPLIVARRQSDPGNYLAGLSPDGRRLVIPGESAGSSAEIFSTEDGAPLGTLAGHDMPVRAAAFSPDGSRIATGSRDHRLQLWDAGTLEPGSTLRGHQDWVLSLSWSPDGRLLASGSVDGTAMLWEVATGLPLARFQDALSGEELAADPPPIRRVQLSPDGERLLAVGRSEVWIYSVNAQGPVALACAELRGRPVETPGICAERAESAQPR